MLGLPSVQEPQKEAREDAQGTRARVPRVIHADCLEAMRAMEADSVDAIVTDPPYGLSFMGRGWDHGVPGDDYWLEALRVAKPGAHLVAFGGTRTFHRLAVAIEDAGWEIRDCLSWLYGSGFPKSLDVSKALDKAAGAERERGLQIGRSGKARSAMSGDFAGAYYASEAATPEAAAWSGWGTALKPAWEPIILARKPLVGTVAANVLSHGTGAINVDACRIGTQGGGWNGLGDTSRMAYSSQGWSPDGIQRDAGGRWPANVALDEEAATMLGAPARFFYCSKASRRERDKGCEALEPRPQDASRDENAPGANNPRNRSAKPRSNSHPTVKPVALMRWLCRLICPPGGTVLDPFCGSGSTLVAAQEEGFDAIGIEREAGYVEIIRARVGVAD